MIRKCLLAEIASQLRCCLLFHSARLLTLVAPASNHFSEQMTVTGRWPRLSSEAIRVKASVWPRHYPTSTIRPGGNRARSEAGAVVARKSQTRNTMQQPKLPRGGQRMS
jgi:hypothetical protein